MLRINSSKSSPGFSGAIFIVFSVLILHIIFVFIVGFSRELISAEHLQYLTNNCGYLSVESSASCHRTCYYVTGRW